MSVSWSYFENSKMRGKIILPEGGTDLFFHSVEKYADTITRLLTILIFILIVIFVELRDNMLATSPFSSWIFLSYCFVTHKIYFFEHFTGSSIYNFHTDRQKLFHSSQTKDIGRTSISQNYKFPLQKEILTTYNSFYYNCYANGF
jgi:ABC-type uncharacterized transport system permease subunit